MSDWTDTNRMAVMALAEECRYAKNRVRELEAELAEMKRRWAAEPEERKRWQTEQIRLAYEQRLEAVARAEKAEKRADMHAARELIIMKQRDEWKRQWDEQSSRDARLIEKAEARIAELEREAD